MKHKSYSDIGDVKFVKRKRAKYVRISVSPTEPVLVSLPYYVSYKSAEKVLLEKMDWIITTRTKSKNRRHKLTIFYFNTFFKTKRHLLNVNPTYTDKFNYEIANGVIRVFIPKKYFIGEKEVQEQIRFAVTEAYRIEAKEYLPERVRALAEIHGFTFNDVKIKNLKSQWGSCSRRKNINLNLHLMRLPDHLIDYIIIHELAHTVEMNHSRKFWNVLDTIFGDAKKLDRQVKQYSILVW